MAEADTARAAPSSGQPRPPLNDAELDRTPRGRSRDAGGLSDRAIGVYRELRRYARGGDLAWPASTTVARRMRCSEDTVQRALRELEAKGYLEPTGDKRGRAVVYRLLRGRAEVYELRPQQPQCAADQPQIAAVREVRTEGGPYGPDLPRSKVEAADEPSPAKAGSSAAERKRTGWRFVSAGGLGGQFVRDPEGTDRPPPGYFADVDRAGLGIDFEPDLPGPPAPEERERCLELARGWLERHTLGGPLPEHELAGGGVCSDCKELAAERQQFGRVELCRPCLARRYAVGLRLAAETVAATSTGRPV